MNKSLKNQLYPSEKEKLWRFGSKDEQYVPRDSDAEKITELIKSILHHENINDSNENQNIKILIHAIYCNKPDMVKDISWVKSLKFDLVKGSIYKIKKYFLENSYLKDTRGGSMIIERLNKDEVINSLQESNLNRNNIIYLGGGNIFLAVPRLMGQDICRKLEERFTKVSATAMNAFETLETSLYDFSFKYKEISKVINDKLLERKKLKIYMPNTIYDNDIESLKELKINTKKVLRCKENYVCELCDIRDAEYVVDEGDDKLYLCPSCIRKHKCGEEKIKFIDQYKDITKSQNIKAIQSINELGDEIAVIYGDGNNMGNIVMNIDNVFEMMYFSDRLDSITKHAVYESIHEVMKDNAKFEVIALGGDDIFIIVPANSCFDITSKIIDKFDEAFKEKSANSTITMSIGVVISKNDTPIASLFNIAQQRLKEAKRITRTSEVNEGTLDIVELLGGIHIDELDNREFPMTNSRFKKILQEFRNSKLGQTQLQKISYAQRNMIEQEFNLFYYYNESKRSKNDASVDQLIKKIYINDKKEQRCNPYKINWDDLIIINKRA